MKLKFLGTGAADWPRIHTDEPEFRRLTSTLVGDSVLIDGTMAVREDLPETVTDVFFTHSHNDHYDLELLQAIAPERIYAHESWGGRIRGVAEVVPLRVGVPVTAGGMTFTPLPANHCTSDENEVALNYLIEGDGRRVLYATDGAWLTCRAHRILGEQPLDAAVFDATIGDIVEGDFRIFEHNSLDMLRLMLKTMHRTGRLPECAPVYLTHLARTLHPGQAELERCVEPPFQVCFDGMEVRI